MRDLPKTAGTKSRRRSIAWLAAYALVLQAIFAFAPAPSQAHGAAAIEHCSHDGGRIVPGKTDGSTIDGHGQLCCFACGCVSLAASTAVQTELVRFSAVPLRCPLLGSGTRIRADLFRQQARAPPFAA